MPVIMTVINKGAKIIQGKPKKDTATDNIKTPANSNKNIFNEALKPSLDLPK